MFDTIKFACFRRPLAALAGVVAITLGAAAPAAAAPALWVVKDEDSTIYLFGTVHVLRPETQWHSPAIDKALADSSELWLELTDDTPEVMVPLVQKYGLDPANPLSTKLSAEQRAKLDAAAASAGLASDRFEAMRPWFAGITLSVIPIVKAGYDPQSGVETKLKAAAAGKPMRALETAEKQIRFFAELPPAVEMEFLDSALNDAQDAPAILDEMVAAWSAGDVAGVERLMVDEMKTDYPELYATLLVERNRDWAEQIDTLLDGKGVIFIAVGSGHLAGDDSVQALLAKRGIKAERVKE